MPFYKTLAAALLGAAVLVAPASAAPLKPYQQQALEKLLKTVPAEHREMAKAQFVQMLAPLSEAQVAMMMQGMAQAEAEAEAELEEEANAPESSDDENYEATPADIAYNEQQYEPVIRKLWQAKRECQAFAIETMEKYQPETTYAVWGQVWRFDVKPLNVDLKTVSADYELFAMSIRPLAPSDGRYNFDFKRVDMSCNKAEIEKAIKKGAADYDAAGKEFMERTKSLNLDGNETSRLSENPDPDSSARAASQIESKANATVSKIERKITETVKDNSPMGETALTNALMNGKRVK